ncbi:ATP-binding protein [Mesorhizobium sp. M7A.F.Ca.ET.027.03.2.1]|uniref:AlbA family DNA-binding domain-containing protein n=1 Tax=Mesorhizobium sp. M7A.F.Ca.ET.027.03.2.1 TaxID=2496656 RepID=UPI000FCBBD90|nr:ATP-binding protein [Mesorhizobium sp. M7A.F.Ca.ET.027.03.2.1]RVD66077.1 ATP-binding protein [Mesorhizobium sp. M7A.F.Ca.ET.027.03.2.1]
MQLGDIVTNGEAALRDAVAQGVQEGLQLDFKLASGDSDGAIFSADGKLGKDGRRLIGKAISAFANSAGGLIVIGANCRRDANGMDALSELKPFPNWKVAQSALNASLGELLQPKHDTIQVHGVGSDRDPAVGYLVIDVPRSERRPHMCQANKQYYKRIGSSSFPMEHYDIEDSFKRFSVPSLAVVPEIHLDRYLGHMWYYEFRFWLKNEGEVSARQPALEVRPAANFDLGWTDEPADGFRQRAGFNAVTYSSANFVVHPGQSRIIDAMAFAVSRGLGLVGETVGGAHILQAQVHFDFFLHALDMPTRKSERNFTFHSLLQLGF